MDRLLEEFLRYEVDDYIRTQLRDATASLTTGSRYFTYNAINFRLDADSGTATVEDAGCQPRRNSGHGHAPTAPGGKQGSSDV